MATEAHMRRVIERLPKRFQRCKMYRLHALYIVQGPECPWETPPRTIALRNECASCGTVRWDWVVPRTGERARYDNGRLIPSKYEWPEGYLLVDDDGPMRIPTSTVRYIVVKNLTNRKRKG